MKIMMEVLVLIHSLFNHKYLVLFRAVSLAFSTGSHTLLKVSKI